MISSAVQAIVRNASRWPRWSQPAGKLYARTDVASNASALLLNVNVLSFNVAVSKYNMPPCPKAGTCSIHGHCTERQSLCLSWLAPAPSNRGGHQLIHRQSVFATRLQWKNLNLNAKRKRIFEANISARKKAGYHAMLWNHGDGDRRATWAVIRKASCQALVT